MDKVLNIAIFDLYLTSALVATLLVLGIAFFIVAYQRKVMKQKQIILEQEKNYQIGLLTAATEGQERERARLSRELHDSVGASLSGARMIMKQLQQTAQLGKNEQQHFDLLYEMLDDGLSNVRSISRDLMPAKLSKLGLSEVLTHFTSRLNASYSGEITFQVDRYERLPEMIELGLFRIAQELVSNGIKHSTASTIQLNLTTTSSQVCLIYKDNGVGADLSLKQEGLGLQSIESRAEIMQGKQQIQSQPGEGFYAIITLEKPFLKKQ